jgi:hypothetical protein
MVRQFCLLLSTLICMFFHVQFVIKYSNAELNIDFTKNNFMLFFLRLKLKDQRA